MLWTKAVRCETIVLSHRTVPNCLNFTGAVNVTFLVLVWNTVQVIL